MLFPFTISPRAYQIVLDRAGRRGPVSGATQLPNGDWEILLSPFTTLKFLTHQLDGETISQTIERLFTSKH